MTIETITDLVHEYMYDTLNSQTIQSTGKKLNTSRDNNTNGNGLTNPVTKDQRKTGQSKTKT